MLSINSSVFDSWHHAATHTVARYALAAWVIPACAASSKWDLRVLVSRAVLALGEALLRLQMSSFLFSWLGLFVSSFPATVLKNKLLRHPSWPKTWKQLISAHHSTTAYFESQQSHLLPWTNFVATVPLARAAWSSLLLPTRFEAALTFDARAPATKIFPSTPDWYTSDRNSWSPPPYCKCLSSACSVCL